MIKWSLNDSDQCGQRPVEVKVTSNRQSSLPAGPLRPRALAGRGAGVSPSQSVSVLCMLSLFAQYV